MGTRYWAVAAAVVACIASAAIAGSNAPQSKKQAQLRGITTTAKAPVEQNIGRMIVKFRDGAGLAGAQPAGGGARVRALESATGVAMEHVRDLAGGASLLALKSAVPLAEAKAMAARLAHDPSVEYAEPDIMMKRLLLPNETRFTDWQWNLFAPTTPYVGISPKQNVTATGGASLPPAWDITPGGSQSVVVAVIDTGIVNHPDLNGNSVPAPYAPGGRFVAGYDFISSDVGAGDGLPFNFVANDGDGRDADPTDPGDWVTTAEETQYPAICDDGVAGPQDSSWHGTHMAGVAGATANNSTGIAGTAYNVKVQPIRALGKCGGALSDISEAIRWAAGAAVPGASLNATPAQVISLSLGGGTTCSSTMQSAVNEAITRGAVVVAATGNDGTVNQVISPANCSGAIGVTAHTINGENADYANIGTGSSISAPGGGSPTMLGAGGTTDDGSWSGYYVWSTLLFGTTTPTSSDSQNQSGPAYGGFTGTSPATPHVAGAAALIRSVQPAASPAFVRAWLTQASSVRPHPLAGFCDTYVQECGRGLLDAQKAVQAAVDAAPAVSVSTATRIVAPGASVTLNGTVTPFPGKTAAGVWSTSGGALSSTTGSPVTLTAPATGYVTVTLTATDSAGKVSRDAVRIRVNSAPTLGPVIGSTTATAGLTVNFTVTATDAEGDPVTFSAVTLPTGATLSPAGAFTWNTAGSSPGAYQLVYRAFDGFSSSSQGTVNISLIPGIGPPVITSGPVSVTVNEGQTATFNVSVTGATPLTYQWRKNGNLISGATGSTYTTPPTTADDNAAQFTVTVSNASGTVTSSPATLTVVSAGVPPPTGGGGGGGALPLGQLLLLAAFLLGARIRPRE
jgi:serine protease